MTLACGQVRKDNTGKEKGLSFSQLPSGTQQAIKFKVIVKRNHHEANFAGYQSLKSIEMPNSFPHQ